MENETQWEISLGMYKGIVFGIRSYENEDSVSHVLYVPFIDICFTIYKK